MKTNLNKSLVKQAVVAAESNRRQATSHVRTRSEVSGGGKKPWKQKGTGRARAGSSRSPLWVGGGKAFGPQRERHYKHELPKKMARKALVELISHVYDEKKLFIVEALSLKTPKTKQVIELLSKHDAANKRVTLVTNSLESELVLAARNLKDVTVVENKNLSILDVAHAQIVMMDQLSAVARGLVKEKTEKKPETKKKTVK